MRDGVDLFTDRNDGDMCDRIFDAQKNQRKEREEMRKQIIVGCDRRRQY